MAGDTWTAVDSSSWFGTSWVCDCGPYLGPTAPEPPTALPSAAAELDFYIFEPSTSDLETVVPLGDYFDAEAYEAGGGVTGFGSFGTVPPGVPHLFATWYPLGFPSDPTTMAAPTATPNGLVPRGYTASAHGPVRRRGHWSDWIDSPPGPVTANVSATDPFYAQLSETFSSTSDYDVGAELETQRVDMAGYVYPASGPLYEDSTSAAYPNFASLHYSARTGKANAGIAPHPPNDALSSLRQFSARYSMPGLDPEPAYLSSLNYGVDYEQNPDTGAFVDYEETRPILINWVDRSVLFDVTVSAQQTVIPFGGFGSPTITPITLPDLGVRVFAHEHDSAADTPPQWRPYGTGTPVDTLSLPVVDGETDTQTVTLHLGTVTQHDLVLVVQLDLQDTTPFPLGNYAQPSGGTINSIIQSVDVLAVASSSSSFQSWHSLDVNYRQPRFRYWVPGPVANTGGVRLNQRNDGLGISRHPRLAATQSPHAPRVGGKNTYQ